MTARLLLHDELLRYLGSRDAVPSEAERERPARQPRAGRVVRLVSIAPSEAVR